MAQPSYRLPSRSKRETLLGLSLAQLLTLVAALLLGLWVFVTAPDWGLIKEASALAVLGLGTVAAFFPIGHYAAIEWLPAILRWWLRERRYQARVEELTFTVTRAGVQKPKRSRPRALGGITILQASRADCPLLGILDDERWRRRVLVVRVRGSGFSLSEAEEQARRIARWGELLATLGRASTPITRVQWIEVAVPEDASQPKRYLMEEGGRGAPDPLLRSYLQLLERTGTVTEHETLVAFGLDLRRLRRPHAGQAERLLVQQVQALAEQLGSEVQMEGVLGPRYLALALRAAFDPLAQLSRARAERAGWEGGLDPDDIWPLRVVEHLGHLEVDGWWHAGYRVVGLPRSPVGPTFAAPLLLQTTCHRRVATTLEPAAPAAALRRLERHRALQLVNQQVRARLGFLPSAAEELRAEEAEQAARELAAGHVLARFTTTIVVSGRGASELEEACREVEQQAALAGIELQRCWGEQLQAFLATLPLCRGLPERR